MRRLLLIFALPLCLATAARASAPADAATALPEWLAGTWAMEHGADWADEVWTSARGGMMLGLGRTGFGPDIQSWETARIMRRPGGSLSFIVQTKGGAAVEFPLAVASAYAIEFANPANAFPQRIRFWREGQLLMTELAKMDGSGAVRTNYRPVETAPRD